MLMTPFAAARDGAVNDALRDQLVATLPPEARIRAQGWRPWASASFVGARHWFDIVGGGDDTTAVERLICEDTEWPVPGSFVADVAVSRCSGDAAAWRIELLTVED